MKLNYKFSNLLGTVYNSGNLVFTPDGNVIISPVGNKITMYDLKNHTSQTMPFESQMNISVVAITPNGLNAILINERYDALFVSLVTKTVLHRHRFSKSVRDLKFSPDGLKFAVCRDIDVQLFRAPDPRIRQYNPFYLETVFHVAHDCTNCLDWSCDSRLFVVGSEDMQAKVCSSRPVMNLFMCPLGGHTSPVIACFFQKNSYNLFTVDKGGSVVHWECSISSADLVPCKRRKDKDTDEEETNEKDESVIKMNYKKLARHFFHDAAVGVSGQLLCAAYHKDNRLLVSGFSSGTFTLHEMPEFNMIHNLSVSECSVKSVGINKSGDWIGVGCGQGGKGQLLVWEWQSETYVMKQQGHSRNSSCLSYSPDGEHIATGAEDGKVKVWKVKSGFCFVTFSEHKGNITGVAWSQGGKAVLSASLDGSVRAFDLKRYRNFRTLTSMEPVQFSCLAVDSSGEIVCAGSRDAFDIFIWSLQTGRLLEVLTGHEAPVSSVDFGPCHPVLVSCSWDKTLRIWDVFEGKGGKEVILTTDEALNVKFSPDGRLVAVICMDSQVTLIDWRQSEEVGSIECRLDLDLGRGENDMITSKKSATAKSFTCINFSTDGTCLLVGGQCRTVCIYSVKELLLLRKFFLTCNLSLDSVAEDIDRRKITEFGSMDLIDTSDSDEDGKSRKKLNLPGVKSGDFSQRLYRPEMRISGVQFSPTGRCWAACSTEGLVIYSLDDSMLFDPFRLDMEITPGTIRLQLRKCEFAKAIMMALRLNDTSLIQRSIEETPAAEISTLCRSLPLLYAEKLLWHFSKGTVDETRHLEFYLLWIHNLLVIHGNQLKIRRSENLETLIGLQQSINRKKDTLARICEHNKFSLMYMMDVRRMDQKKKVGIEDSTNVRETKI